MAQINKPNTHFNTKLYTGNGTTDHAITGVGFQPDLTWVKDRTSANNNILHQIGFTAGQYLRSNTTDELSSSGEMIKSLDSDGFTIGTRAEVNTNSSNYVSWNWLAGGTAVSNTQGSITSTVSANTTSGFSIATWSGTGVSETIGHGLGAVPNVIITKAKSGASAVDGWYTYHSSVGNTQFLELNSTAGATTGNIFDNTTPTTTTFSTTYLSKASTNYVGYFFAEKKGFSKFGSYTGNGSADGPFIYTGFKPAWVMFKRTSAVENWSLYDNKRLGYNPQSYGLRVNTNLAESQYGSTDTVDFVSNGFKIRESGTNINSGTYIYMAFAENPLVGTNNIPATAR